MTDQQHPITPPPELVQQWADEAMKGWRDNGIYERDIATRAAQWGADQELEALLSWLRDELLAARRPKPPTLDSIALQMLGTIERDAHYLPEITDTIRKALEALP
jgi:hypothetical protein